MVEIGVLRAQCIDRRTPDRATLERDLGVRERQPNQSSAEIDRLFVTKRARAKLARSFPLHVRIHHPHAKPRVDPKR